MRLFQLSVSFSAKPIFLLKKKKGCSFFSRKKKVLPSHFTSIWGIRLSSKVLFYHSGLSILIYLFQNTLATKTQNRLGLSGGGAKDFILALKVLEEAGVRLII
jgi:hypothetical protein